MTISNAHEKPVLQVARELADLHGWMHYHAPQCEHARNSEPGFPDLILVRVPRLVSIEIKRAPSDKPTAEQLRWLLALSEVRTADSYVLRPGPTWDDLEAELR